MRRSMRNGDLAVHSDQIPESLDTSSSRSTTGFWEDPALPKFRFIQSSPHSGVLNVNGEVETVHWVVKDRPFAIRILEVPFARGDREANQKMSGREKVNEDEDEFAWNEIEVRSDVVFTKTHKSVKMPSASEKSALSIDQSVIPASVYNHRRSANLLAQHAYISSLQEPSSSSSTSHHHHHHASSSSTTSTPQSQGSLLLKGGSGIELSVRLAVLSSHVRNDFCVHLQLILRGQLIADWFSETIKSVSKWDKVRQLQDTSATAPKSHHYNRSHPTPHHTSNRNLVPRHSIQTSTTPISIIPTTIGTNRNNNVKRVSREQASQKPVSSSIKHSPLQTDDDLSAPTNNTPEGLADTTSTSNAMDLDVMMTPQRKSAAPSSSSSRPSRAKSAPSSRSSSSSLLTEYMNTFDEEHSASDSVSGKNGKQKKKASGEEVFEMLERLQRVQEEMALLIQQSPTPSLNHKKRAATWEPAAEAKKPNTAAGRKGPSTSSSLSSSRYPTEQEAAEGARLMLEQAKSNNKKAKRFEVSSRSEVHRLAKAPVATPTTATTTTEYKPGDLASNVHSFLNLLDQSVLAHVRSGLTGFLLTRPDLSAILQRMMTDASHSQSEAAMATVTSSPPVPSGTSEDDIEKQLPYTAASWSQTDQIPMLNQSGFLWTDERYETGQSEGVRGLGEMENFDEAFVPAPVFSAVSSNEQQQQQYYAASIMSPHELDEESMDDSTTTGSPSYAAWSDEWSATEPSSPSFESTSSPHQNPSLTDSTTMMFSGFIMETPAGF